MIALPPKRSRRKKAASADMKAPVIVEARDPRRLRRSKAMTSTVVDNSGPNTSEDDRQQRGGAADQLFQEIKRAVAESGKP